MDIVKKVERRERLDRERGSRRLYNLGTFLELLGGRLGQDWELRAGWN